MLLGAEEITIFQIIQTRTVIWREEKKKACVQDKEDYHK